MKADHAKVSQALKTARGQIDGILRMVDEDRYCMDISNQLLATEALLKKTNKLVLEAHLHSCVAESFSSGTDVDQKIGEIIRLLDKLTN
ncbi:MAG: metal-sensing transcriptional repressor [Sphaerochaetaceae bacterium]|jgi:DNA-binding FrmR family transcriptional regulator|nr:metal-sensing transcriptional repressor [Sphaerochaetaceae bacterium]MDD3942598.1 metal-sensing transcriptional repressor [Sphaerochaetaceae bacterium]MDX9939541.1 metal-sensing transcriptional repressor [Sphaerochaetaceae bacterium]